MLTSCNSKYRSTDLSSAHLGVLLSNMYSLPFLLLPLPKVKCAVRSIPSSHLSSVVSQYSVGVDLDNVRENTSTRAHKYAYSGTANKLATRVTSQWGPHRSTWQPAALPSCQRRPLWGVCDKVSPPSPAVSRQPLPAIVFNSVGRLFPS